MTPASPHKHDHDRADDFGRCTKAYFVGSGLTIICLALYLTVRLAGTPAVGARIMGTAMVLSAGLQLSGTMVVRRHHAVGLWIVSGLFYLFGALLIMLDTVISKGALTLGLALALTIAGVGRLVIGARERVQWVLLSGCGSILAGTVIGMDWPQDAFWTIAALLVLDLLVQGIAFTMTGACHRFAVIGDDD